MKVLSIKVPSGYKMLSKNFEINFMTKTRVDKNSINEELFKLEPNFYYPIETVFIGKNSSGKTTTLSLIDSALMFLINGRFENDFLNDKGTFDIEIVFYDDGFIYKYAGSFLKDTTKNNQYLIITKESLGKTTLKDSYKKDLSNASFSKVVGFKSNEDGDTSDVCKMIKEKGFNYSIDRIGKKATLFEVLYVLLREKTFNAIVKLFDDSIDTLVPYLEGKETVGFMFKRVGSDTPIVVKNEYLESNLSEGTIRGMNLYGLSILAFKYGGTIMVDEIERSFNRNLIENLLLMFKDETINRKNANIVYSTHYSELLDMNNRCDNINVLHRHANEISLKNMCSDYEFRTDMLKSTSFNQNAFDTLINYDRLIELKETLRK